MTTDPVMRDLYAYLQRCEQKAAIDETLAEYAEEAREELLQDWDCSEPGWEQELEHEALLEARSRLRREMEDDANERRGRKAELRNDWLYA